MSGPNHWLASFLYGSPFPDYRKGLFVERHTEKGSQLNGIDFQLSRGQSHINHKTQKLSSYAWLLQEGQGTLRGERWGVGGAVGEMTGQKDRRCHKKGQGRGPKE